MPIAFASRTESSAQDGPSLFGNPAAAIAALGFASVQDFQLSFARFDLRTDGAIDWDTERAVQMVLADRKLSPHFGIDEFKSKATGQVVVHRTLLRGLEALREATRTRIAVVHGFRSPKDEGRLEAMGLAPAPRCQHRWGLAADIGRADFAVVRNLGLFSGIGCKGSVGGPVIHVDVRHAGQHNATGSTTADPAVWIYA
jgi:hypothetical protein